MRYNEFSWLWRVACGACVLVTLAPRATDAQATTPLANLAAVREELTREADQRRIIGAVVGLRHGDDESLRWAVGLADIEQARSMSIDCAFRIGSISKVFVGTALLVLAGEGRLSLDDPIETYVRGVPNGARITIRHLGSHRAGLFNYIESSDVKEAFARDPARSWTLDEVLSLSYQRPPYFEPGSDHHYSNAHTILLAKVIERVTGNSWQHEVRSRVIEPLGLRETIIPDDPRLPSPHAEGYAFGSAEGPFFHRGPSRFRVTDTSPTWWGPGGLLVSTTADLLKAAKPLATGALLTAPMRAELQAWTATDDPHYQYGFHLARARGRLGHDGDVPGYHTVMYYVPELDTAIVVLTNVYGWSLRARPADHLTQVLEKHLQTRTADDDEPRGAVR